MRLFHRHAHRQDVEYHQLPPATPGEEHAWLRDYVILSGHHDLDVVGESHYQEDLWRAANGQIGSPDPRQPRRQPAMTAATCPARHQQQRTPPHPATTSASPARPDLRRASPPGTTPSRPAPRTRSPQAGKPQQTE
jgi:hypothetical protein